MENRDMTSDEVNHEELIWKLRPSGHFLRKAKNEMISKIYSGPNDYVDTGIVKNKSSNITACCGNKMNQIATHMLLYQYLQFIIITVIIMLTSEKP